jgi:UDP-2,4-diacetamido-2,4,6-trideoxy-beta-L-altropyranose hydrolase
MAMSGNESKGRDGMRVMFRVDASLAIGTGHVFRCLTLARALRARGVVCEFICAQLPGHMGEPLRAQGLRVHLLPRDEVDGPLPVAGSSGPAHLHWLQAEQAHDAQQTLAVLEREGLACPDWWVVDHYGLDAQWERAVKGGSRIAVIDDLADREHACDVLTDPGVLRCAEDYAGRVPVHCRLLIGPRFALLRDEFVQWRAASLARRAQAQLCKVLVFMGGMDPQSGTARVMRSLAQLDLREPLQVTVVMGQQAPSLASVQALMADVPAHWCLLTHVNDMARLMSEADLAIGACGTTVWERACLGLPSICAVLADNQVVVGEHLQSAGIARVVHGLDGLGQPLQDCVREMVDNPQRLSHLATQSAQCTNGTGAGLLADALCGTWESGGQSGASHMESPAS